MLICSNCNNEQESGKFCGVCGGALQAAQSQQGNPPVQPTPENSRKSQVAATTTSKPQTQQTTETIKNGLSEYWSYFLNVVKNPTRAFQLNESHFVNGIINMALYVVFFALGLYLLINSLAKSFMGVSRGMFGNSADYSLPFFQVFFRTASIALLFIAIAFVSILVMIKLAKIPVSIKDLIAQFGGLLIPFVALNILGTLAGLFGSFWLTLLIMAVSLIFISFIVPTIVVFEKGKNITDHKVYLSLASSALAMFITFVLVRGMFIDFIKEFGEVIEMLGYL